MKAEEKNMKWLFLGLGTAIAVAAIAGGIAAVRRKSPDHNSDNIDGGVVKRCWSDAPKIIESTEIVGFHCQISLLASCETDGLGHRVYTLDADLDNDSVLVKTAWYQRQGGSDKNEYRTDAVFLVRLQEIVAAHDLARHNGYYHTVSGLPDMYGESLHIVYASGERISVHDNQNGFLPSEAVKELIMLFGAATKLENE